MSNITSLPYLPLQTAWIEQHPAFVDPQSARLLPAVIKLLFAAWRGLPAGSLPSSHAFIAQASGLGLEEVSQHFVTLTHDFVLHEDGRLHHTGLSRICAALVSNYGKEIDSFAMSLAMASQSPQEFAVASFESANTKRPRGKTALPPAWNFHHDPEMLNWVAAQGFAEDHQRQWLLQRFRDFCMSRDVRSKNFDAEFRLFVENTISRFASQIPLSLAAQAEQAAQLEGMRSRSAHAPALAATSTRVGLGAGVGAGVQPPGLPNAVRRPAPPLNLAPPPVGLSAPPVPSSAALTVAAAQMRGAYGFRAPGMSKGEEAQHRARSSLEVARSRMEQRAAGLNGASPSNDFFPVNGQAAGRGEFEHLDQYVTDRDSVITVQAREIASAMASDGAHQGQED